MKTLTRPWAERNCLTPLFKPKRFVVVSAPAGALWVSGLNLQLFTTRSDKNLFHHQYPFTTRSLQSNIFSCPARVVLVKYDYQWILFIAKSCFRISASRTFLLRGRHNFACNLLRVTDMREKSKTYSFPVIFCR